MNFKLPQGLQKELDKKVEKSEQFDFIHQAVLSALKNKIKTKEKNKRTGGYEVYTDGGARGNPGIAGCGGVIFNEKKNKVVEFKHFIPYATNNEAEYKALLLGVEKVIAYIPEMVSFYLDSELVVKQMNGQYKVKKPELKKIHLKICKLLKEIPIIRFVHIPREQNQLADKLANEAMDEN